MNTDDLKSLQAPLKERYRDDPSSALVTLRSHGETTDSVSCKLSVGKALAEAGLHPATGGDGSHLCSGDMLLDALVACAGVTLRAVSTSMGLKIDRASVSAEGDIDFKGTLAIDKSSPVGFKEIRLAFEVKSSEPAESIGKLIQLTERYCVVYQTISAGVPSSVSVKTT